MKRIHYASGTLVTGDAIADVLMRYAASLAANNSAADVHAPAILESGAVGDVQLLLGPASQILAEDEPGDRPELEDSEFVAAGRETGRRARAAACGVRRTGYGGGGVAGHRIPVNT